MTQNTSSSCFLSVGPARDTRQTRNRCRIKNNLCPPPGRDARISPGAALPAALRAGTLQPMTPPSPAPHRTPIPPLPGIGWGLIALAARRWLAAGGRAGWVWLRCAAPQTQDLGADRCGVKNNRSNLVNTPISRGQHTAQSMYRCPSGQIFRQRTGGREEHQSRFIRSHRAHVITSPRPPAPELGHRGR